MCDEGPPGEYAGDDAESLRQTIAAEEQEGERHERKHEEGTGDSHRQDPEGMHTPTGARHRTAGEKLDDAIGSVQQAGDHVVPASSVPQRVGEEYHDDAAADARHAGTRAAEREKYVVAHPGRE